MNNHLSLERKLLTFVLILLFIAPVFADHNSTANLQPEWSPAGQNVNYVVNISNDGPDAIKEVRIYQNPNHTNFDCKNKTNWTLVKVYNYPDPGLGIIDLCWYYTDNDHAIPANSSENFEFSATTPGSGCNWQWKFETRDMQSSQQDGFWRSIYDNTSVDDLAPNITKTIGEPNYGNCPPGENDICWVTTSTHIDVSVIDQGVCGISGLDWCSITYTIDKNNNSVQEEVYQDLNGNISWNYKMNFNEDSIHVLNITCQDIAGNRIEDIETFKVDSTPPETNKTYGDPYYTDNISEWITNSTPITLTAEDGGEICAIGVNKTYYRVTLVSDECCLEYCENAQGAGDFAEYVSSFNINEESCHLIEYYSVDNLSNTENIKKQCVFVDNTPPIGTKIIGDPKKQCEDGEGCNYWVSQNTLITLTCTDQLPHPVDNEKVCYKIYVDNDDKTECYCSHYNGSYNQTTGYCCFSKQTTINFLEDSNHTLEYYCEDALGNKNDVDTEYFKVDSQKPIIDKTLIGPQVGDCPPEYEPDGDTHECWIKDWTCEQGEGTIIHVEANDDDTYGCVVDQVICQWWYTLDGGQDKYYTDEYEIYDGKSGWLTPPFDIKFYDDTVHELHINCTDALGNWYEDVETFYVDSQGPVVNKSFIGPQKIVPMFNYGDVEWIDGVTLVNLTAEDLPDAPCAVGLDKIYWRNELAPSDDWCYYPEQHCTQIHNPQEPGWTNYTGPFNKINESCHILEYYAVDKLGNIGPVGVNCFFVDKTAPNVTKDNGEAIPDSGEGNFTTPENPNGDFHWITTSMPIKFICEDQGPHPSGDEKLCFKVSYDYPEWNYITNDYCEDNLTSDGYCCVSATPESPYTFYFKEESMHNLEYYCVDAVNKSSEKHIQYYKVDDTPPNVTKIINGPYFGQCPPESCEDKCYVDTATNITLEIEDGGEICAVGNVTCKWKYKVNQGDWSDWFIYSEENPISFPEECNHELYIECEDALGNTWSDTEYFIVDKTPPNTTKHYEGPHFKDEETGTEWITNETNITLTAIDPEPHPSGVNKTWYRDVYLENESDWHYCYSDCDEWVNDSKGRATVWDIVNGLPTAPEPYNPSSSRGFMLYEGPFKLQKESCHIIEYYSYDNVGKVEQVKHQCVFVDNTPPEPNKTIGEPKTYCEGEECNSWEWKITTMTPITLSCEDKGPHPVDNSTVYWRIWWDYNDNWTEWYNATEGTKIYLEEKCLHQLEFYCVDALGHESEHDIEKIKVEGTSFNIQLNKKWNLISVPFVMLDDSIDEVFKDVANETEAVWTYDPENEICDDEWCVYTPGEGPDTLDEMTPGWGYWVLMNSSAMKEDSVMLTIGGDLFMEGVKPPDKTIVHGWNLIGYYGTNGLLVYDGPDKEGKPAYCALFDLGESYLDKGWSSLISYWKGDWLEYTYCDNMDPGAGYWLRATENGSYGYTTNCGLGDLIC